MLHNIQSILQFLLFVSSVQALETGGLKSKPPNLKLLECFEFKKNYWIVGHAFHTSSVQVNRKKSWCIEITVHHMRHILRAIFRFF